MKYLESTLKIPRNLSVAHIRYDQVVSCAIIILYVYILCNSVEGFLFFFGEKIGIWRGVFVFFGREKWFGEVVLFCFGEKNGLARCFCFFLARKVVWRGGFFWREKWFGEPSTGRLSQMLLVDTSVKNV